MENLWSDIIDSKNYFFQHLKMKSQHHAILLLLFTSCTNFEEKNEVNIRVHTSMDQEASVLLKVNDKTLVNEKTKPYREMNERVKVFSKQSDSVTVFHKVGDRDTTFAYRGKDKVNFLSIGYSRWWNKFLVLEEDSAQFNSGGDDIVYYD